LIGPRFFFLLVPLLITCAWRGEAQTPPPAPQQTPPPAQPPAPAPAPKIQTPPPLTQPSAPVAAPAPAAKPKVAEEGYETSDGQTSLRLMYWFNPTHPLMKTGHGATIDTTSNVPFYGNNKPTPGAELSFGLGKNHTLRLSYFRTQGKGNGFAPNIPAYLTYFVWSASINPGDYLATSYTLQNAKISLDYLSWPFPVHNARFRVKTLWEVQYTTIRSTISAPLDATTDASGNPITTSGTGSNWFIWPSLGMGVEYMATKHFRFEARASGFALPHFATLYDLDAFFAYRGGQWEIDVGGKDFHFKTSPRRPEYVYASLPGAYVGLRWFLR